MMGVAVKLCAPRSLALRDTSASASRQRSHLGARPAMPITRCHPAICLHHPSRTATVSSAGAVGVVACSASDVSTGGGARPFGKGPPRLRNSAQNSTAGRSASVHGAPSPQVGKASGLSVALEVATLPQLRPVDARAACWYERALELARQQQFEHARRVFEATVKTYPNLCRAWVSWAQMEKKARGSQLLDYESCRVVLQRGLQLNPTSSCLCQAWGLMELQKGNAKAAVWLLDRSAIYDPKCKPVQRWKLYKEALEKSSVSSKSRTTRGC